MTATMVRRHESLRWIVRGCLVVVGTFGVVRSIGYSPVFSPEQLPRGVELITGVIPIGVWSLLWFLAGLLSLTAAIRVWPIGTLGVITLSVSWAVGYTGSWIFSYHYGWAPWSWWPYFSHVTVTPIPGPPTRDYLSASVYWTIALLLIGGHRLARAALTLSRGIEDAGDP